MKVKGKKEERKKERKKETLRNRRRKSTRRNGDSRRTFHQICFYSIISFIFFFLEIKYQKNQCTIRRNTDRPIFASILIIFYFYFFWKPSRWTSQFCFSTEKGNGRPKKEETSNKTTKATKGTKKKKRKTKNKKRVVATETGLLGVARGHSIFFLVGNLKKMFFFTTFPLG